MSDDQTEVEAATRRFYAAIEDMVSGRGLDGMLAAWHHTSFVTGKHPSGDWSRGWDEVWATWQLFSSFGRPEGAGSRIDKVKGHVCGDLAYVTSVFQASPLWGGEKIMCTNVLQRIGGEWKVIHHHADPSPGMAKALERMIEGG